MPVPREDLLELLLVQDKIANRTKDVSGIVLGRKMQIPLQLLHSFLNLLNATSMRPSRPAKVCANLMSSSPPDFAAPKLSLFPA